MKIVPVCQTIHIGAVVSFARRKYNGLLRTSKIFPVNRAVVYKTLQHKFVVRISIPQRDGVAATILIIQTDYAGIGVSSGTPNTYIAVGCDQRVGVAVSIGDPAQYGIATNSTTHTGISASGYQHGGGVSVAAGKLGYGIAVAAASSSGVGVGVTHTTGVAVGQADLAGVSVAGAERHYGISVSAPGLAYGVSVSTGVQQQFGVGVSSPYMLGGISVATGVSRQFGVGTSRGTSTGAAVGGGFTTPHGAAVAGGISYAQNVAVGGELATVAGVALSGTYSTPSGAAFGGVYSTPSGVAAGGQYMTRDGAGIAVGGEWAAFSGAGGIAISGAYLATNALGGGIAVGGTMVVAADYSSAGGFVVGGGDNLTRVANYRGADGAVVSGSVVSTTNANYSSEGGAIVGGAVVTNVAVVLVSDGGIVADGAEVVRVASIFSGVGGAVSGGSSLATMTKVYAASGGIRAGGSATSTMRANFLSDGGLVSGGSATVNVVAVIASDGGIVTDGSETVIVMSAYRSVGGAVPGGDAELVRVMNLQGEGGIVADSIARTRVTAEYASVGGAIAGGLSGAEVWRAQNYGGRGGIRVGGSADCTRVSVQLRDSTGLILGGNALVFYTCIYQSDGGVVLGGTATINRSALYSSEGGARVGGTAEMLRAVEVKSAGGARVGGAVILNRRAQYQSGGGARMGGSAEPRRIRDIKSDGGACMGGGGTLKRRVRCYSSEGARMGGTTTTTRSILYSSSGGVRMGGVGAVNMRALYFSSGGARMGGTAIPTKLGVYASSGGARMGGTAVPSRGVVYQSSGGARMGGTATYRRGVVCYSSEGARMGGTTTATRSVLYSSSGGARVGGTASSGTRAAYYTSSGGARVGGGYLLMSWVRTPLSVTWGSFGSRVYEYVLPATDALIRSTTGATANIPGIFSCAGGTPNAGTTSVNVTFTPTDTSYAAVTRAVPITVAKKTVSYNPFASYVSYNGTAYLLANNSGYTMNCTVIGATSTNTIPAVPHGGSFTVGTDVGSYTILFSVTNSANYTGGGTTTLVINKQVQVLSGLSVTYSPGANTPAFPRNLLVTDTGVITIESSGASGNPVVFSVDPPSANNTVCSITGSTLVLTGVGTFRVAANQAGNDSYAAATTIYTGALPVGAIGTTFSFLNQSHPYDGQALTVYNVHTFALEYFVDNVSIGILQPDGGMGEAELTVGTADVGSWTVRAVIVSNTYSGSQTATYSITPAAQVIGTISVAWSSGNATTVNSVGTISVASKGGSASPVVYTSSAPSVASISGTTITLLAPGAYQIYANQAGTSNYDAAPQKVSGSYTVGKLTATISSANVVVTYNGASHAASAVITPAAAGAPSYTYNGGTAVPLNAGTYTVVATINNATYYGTATWTITINKTTQAALTLTMNPTAITQAGSSQGSVTGGTGPGAVTYYSNLGTIGSTSGTLLAPGVTGTATIYAIKTGTVNYLDVQSNNATVVIGKLTPTITWATPAEITYGTALSATQLSNAASASVPGTFVFSPAAGTVLGAGSRSLTCTFTPTDTVSYEVAYSEVWLTVNKAQLTYKVSSLSVPYGFEVNSPPVSGNVTGFAAGESFATIGLVSFSIAGYTYNGVQYPVGTILASGTYTIQAIGISLIATAMGNYYIVSEATSIVVGAPPAAQATVYCTVSTTSLTVGNTATATGSGGSGTGAFYYTSSNSSVASVTNAGVITAVAAGTASMSARRAASTGYAISAWSAWSTAITVSPVLPTSFPSSITARDYDAFSGQTVYGYMFDTTQSVVGALNFYYNGIDITYGGLVVTATATITVVLTPTNQSFTASSTTFTVRVVPVYLVYMLYQTGGALPNVCTECVFNGGLINWGATVQSSPLRATFDNGEGYMWLGTQAYCDCLASWHAEAGCNAYSPNPINAYPFYYGASYMPDGAPYQEEYTGSQLAAVTDSNTSGSTMYYVLYMYLK